MTFAISDVSWSYYPFPIVWFSHFLPSPFVFMRNKDRKTTTLRECPQSNFLQAFDQIGDNNGRVIFFWTKKLSISIQFTDLENQKLVISVIRRGQGAAEKQQAQVIWRSGSYRYGQVTLQTC